MKMIAGSHLVAFLIILFCYDVKGEEYKVHKLSRRLVGGANAYPGQVPYMANLRYWGDHFCGGTIIDAHWILTAAHCLDFDRRTRQDKFRVAVGTIYSAIDSGDEDTNSTEVEYKISKFIKHPGHRYTIEHQYNDIAVVKLETPLKFSAAVQPVKIGRISDDSVPVFTAGWGRTGADSSPDILQHEVLSTMEIKRCQKIHDEANNIVDGVNQICVHGGKGKSLCAGDSGGPVVRIDTGRVVGVFIGYEDCNGHYPNLCSRISAYVDWLRNVTNLELPLD